MRRIFLISTLFLILIMPVTSHFQAQVTTGYSTQVNSNTSIMELLAGDDNPWDPGDEHDPPPKPSKKHCADRQQIIASKDRSDDDPWDPGDESPKVKG